ncbi:MAG TPA: hypothetical protein VK420_09835, partial [Longimicrobium sp.]|nr:hypothetical protein [Longimicrobium sp.]
GWYGPHWFDRRFDVTTGELRGGLPVPRLAGFTVRQRLFCTSDVRRDMPATVRLAAAAGSRGAFVQVGTALPGQATRTIWVPPGQREQNLNIPIPAGTEGAYSAYASSGGVIVQRAIVVRPPVDCAPGEDPNSFNYLAPRAVEPLLGFCGPPCFARLQMNARGELIISGAQGTFLHSPQTGLHWINGYVGAGTLSGVTLGDAGHIAGTITDPQGAVQGFTLGPLDPDAPIAVHKLPSFSPVAVNAYGVIAGARHGNKGPAVWRDRAVVPLDFGLGEPLEPVAIDDQGFLLVRGVQGGWTGLSDYRRVKPLAVGAQPVRASAMSSSGLVAGAVVLDGVERPYIHDALSGKTTVLDVPAGYAGARAVDANSAGWVLVQAAPRADKRGPGVFLYQPGQPVRPLASFLAEPSDVEIIKGLAIADSGDVLVRGVRRGVVGHFVLQAWIKPFEPESK